MLPSRLPSSGEVDAFLVDLRRQSERLRGLADGPPADAGDLAQAIDEIAERLLVADEELRVQAEQLDQSSHRMSLLVTEHEALFDSAPTPYLHTDMDGLVVRYNQAARRLLNLPLVGRRSRTLQSLVRPADRPAVRDMLSRFRISGATGSVRRTAESLEVVIPTPDGHPAPVALTARRASEVGTSRSLLHWELRLIAERTRPALFAAKRRTIGARPTHAQALAEAATDLAGLETPALVLDRIVEHARRVVPGCDEAGALLLRERQQLHAPVATGELAAAGDQLQRDLGEGPCVAAINGSRLVVIEDMTAERRWPEFASRAVGLGAASMLAVPLMAQRGARGALSLYARSPGGFPPDHALIGQAYAAHASIALAHAELADNLRIALQTREEVGRAVGILMERHRVTAAAAFDMLVVASQHSHRKVRDVAAWMTETGEDPAVLVRPSRPERGSR